MFDLIIHGGTIVDGTRRPAYQANVAVNGDKIVDLSPPADAPARRRIDATNLVVAPGFIDVHNHSDAWLLKTPHLLPKTRQGFTTEVLMADGISYAPVNEHTAREWVYYLRALNALTLPEYRGWRELDEYMALLDRRCAQNFACHVPYANVRTLLCGFGSRPVDDYQMKHIRAAILRGMEQGAVGLSTGLDYIAQCYSTTDELVRAAAVMAPLKGLYVTHVRYKTGVVAGVREAIEIGRRAGVPIHISHLKGTNPTEVEQVLELLDRVDADGVDLSFDVYPYVPGSTLLAYLLPYEVWEDGPLGVLPRLREPRVRERFAEALKSTDLATFHIAWVASHDNQHLQGRRLNDIIEEIGKPAAEVICDLLTEEGLAVLMVQWYSDDDAIVEPFLAHPRFMLGSDGIYHPDGVIHPRMYGSVGRILGRSVRDKRLFSLEDAVYKLSGHPAERFALRRRGTLVEGNFADLVVFDPQQVTDLATYEDPHQYCPGIQHVIVNGVPIIDAGQAIEPLPEPLPGRALRARDE